MTDPRLDDPKPLEPWMLELLREDGSDRDPQTREELSRVVALLRSLPDPESPPDLSGRVLAYVAEQQPRPRVMRVLFGRPAASLLVAAAMAGVFAVTFTPETIPSALRITTGETGVTRAEPPRRRPPLVRPTYVSSALGMPAVAVPQMGFSSAPAQDAFAMRLDHQLNQLMMNPTAFAQRLEFIAQRDRFIARLAERAAERGDAAEIALRVRESPHPLAGVLVERLLGAQLVAEVSPRR